MTHVNVFQQAKNFFRGNKVLLHTCVLSPVRDSAGQYVLRFPEWLQPQFAVYSTIENIAPQIILL